MTVKASGLVSASRMARMCSSCNSASRAALSVFFAVRWMGSTVGSVAAAPVTPEMSRVSPWNAPTRAGLNRCFCASSSSSSLAYSSSAFCAASFAASTRAAIS
jgi:hypothetical protein